MTMMMIMMILQSPAAGCAIAVQKTLNPTKNKIGQIQRYAECPRSRLALAAQGNFNFLTRVNRK